MAANNKADSPYIISIYHTTYIVLQTNPIQNISSQQKLALSIELYNSSSQVLLSQQKLALELYRTARADEWRHASMQAFILWGSKQTRKGTTVPDTGLIPRPSLLLSTEQQYCRTRHGRRWLWTNAKRVQQYPIQYCALIPLYL